MSKHLLKAFNDGNTATNRPECVTPEHLRWLDDLRDSGGVNMFGARQYLMEEFEDLTEAEAATVMGYWMQTFGKPNR